MREQQFIEVFGKWRRVIFWTGILSTLSLVLFALYFFPFHGGYDIHLLDGWQPKLMDYGKKSTVETLVFKFPGFLYKENRSRGINVFPVHIFNDKILFSEPKNKLELQFIGEYGHKKRDRFSIPYMKLANPKLLPRNLENFVEAVENARGSQIQFYWQVSRIRFFYEFLFGNLASLDESSAFRVKAEMYGKNSVVFEKDLSQYFFFPFLYLMWFDFPLLLFSLAVYSIFFGFYFRYDRKYAEKHPMEMHTSGDPLGLW